MLCLYNSASEYVYSARWMKREGEKKTREWQPERERDILQTILSNVTSVQTELRERGWLCHFNKRGHWISGGYGEKLISLFSKVTWPVFIPLSDSLLFLNHSFMGSLLEKFTNKLNFIPSWFWLFVGDQIQVILRNEEKNLWRFWILKTYTWNAQSNLLIFTSEIYLDFVYLIGIRLKTDENKNYPSHITQNKMCANYFFKKTSLYVCYRVATWMCVFLI